MSTLRTGAIELDDRSFAYIAALIRERAGIVIADGKRSMVQSRLMRRLRALRIESIDEYLELLASGDPSELEEVTNVLTTNLTSFFREAHHFEMLEDLVEHHQSNRCHKLRIWSSACSTGQEPYSIAMALREFLPRSPQWDVKILATDLDSDVLAKARAGEYAGAARGGLTPDRERFFESVGEDMLRARSELRDLIRFRQLNLLQQWPMRGPFDAIFCRNVMIYFDGETRERLVDRLVGLLRQGGFLFLGHSESLCGNHPKLKALGRTAFRKGGA